VFTQFHYLPYRLHPPVANISPHRLPAVNGISVAQTNKFTGHWSAHISMHIKTTSQDVES